MEKYLFFILMCVNIIPILTPHFFLTLDGPAHLYNASLINDLLINDSKFLNEFFTFNSVLVPNWTSHIFLSFFSAFLPAHIAEKILLITIVTGIPLSFRLLVKSISKDNYYVAFLAFPIAYNMLLFYGFYNFCLAIIMFNLTLCYWLKKENKLNPIPHSIGLTILLLVTYFSHLLVFLFLVIILGCRMLFNFLKRDPFLPTHRKSVFLVLCSAISIPLMLSFIYFHNSTAENNTTFLSFSEKMDRLFTGHSLISLHGDHEGLYVNSILIAVLVMFLFSKNILSKFKRFNYDKITSSFDPFWILVATLTLLFYLTMPDVYGSGAFISTRFIILFFLLFFLSLASLELNPGLRIPFVIVVIVSHSFCLKYYNHSTNSLAHFSKNAFLLGKEIESGALVYPINTQSNWLLDHCSNYIGLTNDVVILDNYECFSDHFPLKWDKSLRFSKFPMIKDLIEDFSIKIEKDGLESTRFINYVAVLGRFEFNGQSNFYQLESQLRKNYSLVYSNYDWELYKRNDIPTSSP